MATSGLVPAAIAIGLLVHPLPAIAACAEAGGAATCTGTLPAGANYSSGVTSLTVSALTANIAPANGYAISLTGAGSNGSKGANQNAERGSRGGGGGTAGPALTLTASLGGFTATATDAPTIFAQSRGGRGGNGGDGTIIGGDGSNGGDGAVGGVVNVVVTGRVGSTASSSAAISAQSIGGNGGGGGDGANEGNGGRGGRSGEGGNVSIRATARIDTSGASQVGIAALSQGGIAGNGGSGGGVFTGDGGDGGGASPGGSAVIYSQSEIHTSGVSAVGIFAQSLGGQGGSGGDAGSLFYSSGGDGVYGAAGGLARATNAAGAGVFTTGEVAHGVVALSVGGGGGAGGSAFGIVALGSGGGTGGPGGTAQVINNGLVQTTGRSAVGLMATSIGGGGGDGGSSSGIASFGGKGSGTSSGGIVSVTNTWRVTTAGDSAQGIFAQSIGGGGGRGGSAGGLVTFGGSGGGGGNGGAVTVSSTGSVATTGQSATGIVAQSIGGGGGQGGNAVSLGVGVAVAFGGSGGKGGAGGNVTVNGALVTPAAGTPAPSVTTTGDGSIGIFGQSIGGGGGASGYAVAASAGLAGSISFAFGASGGDGGNGGTVLSRYRGTVDTLGDNATGILLQSVGGGGGNSAIAVAVAGGGNVGVSAAVGGRGGVGGTASSVTFDGAAAITTSGNGSTAMMLQSIGGGGGNGGAAVAGSAGGNFSASLSIGGAGAQGGLGGNVVATNRGTIATSGIMSHGIVAQSIGGGGGNGGLALGASMAGNGAMTVSLGGSAAAGGAAGNVTLTHATIEPGVPAPGRNYGILTTGDASHGVIAQSIGGGGGMGGIAGSLAGASGGAIGVTLGGSGGSGAAGGNVSVVLNGPIDTWGQRAYGLFAQSVGGGGGDGGYAFGLAAAGVAAGTVQLGGSGGTGGVARDVSITGDGRVQTRGDTSIAILAQSVGGGGGAGGLALGVAAVPEGGAVSVSLGGTGGSGGHGGTVTVDRGGRVITGTYDPDTGIRTGERAHGIVAQSIGGGGGVGGFVGNIAGAGVGGAAVIGLGGSGGVGGDGGTVNLTQRGGLVQTWGDGALGLLAQSVGGGGGDGGFAVGATATGKGLATTVNVGGSGAIGGRAGTVTLTTSGSVITAGDLATAVTAQSIGGGGGTGGFAAGLAFSGKGGALTASLGGTGGPGGDAGSARAVVSGSIFTTGDLAHGVFVQSVGGGGGTGGIAAGAAVAAEGVAMQATLGGSGGSGGQGGAAVLQQTGSVLTTGDGAHALFAQSIGGGGGDGGMAIGVTGSGQNGLGLGATLGGSGAGGGDGGTVSLTSSDAVQTEGALSFGIFAQSIGGGGGNGGMALAGGLSLGKQAAVTLGGSGAGGGNGGAVEILRRYAANTPIPAPGVVRSLGAYGLPAFGTATLVTEGGGSHAIVAQSIGGGGGNGGLAGTLMLNVGNSAMGASVALGGSGAGGGNGGVVNVAVADRIRTGGSLPTTNAEGEAELPVALLRATGLSAENGAARGVVAQSIGGGGGDGGGAIALGISTNTEAKQVNVALGGSAGTGGTGGVVTVTVVGSVQTQGFASDAILAQSIGGGGGTGGFSAAGSITTGKGMTAQLALGGSGGAGGAGGNVRASMQGIIATDGDQARGIVAQSIGGGGGTGGLSVAGTLALSPTGGGHNAQLSIGGTGGTGGNAGQADVRTIGGGSMIATSGADAYGIVAQSIGGGGGMGGLSVAALMGLAGSEASTAVNVAIGGSGGAGGTGGHATVDNVARIETTGLNAFGILAQSVGGGGGAGGGAIAGMARIGDAQKRQLAVTVSVGGSGGAGNTGGVVQVTNAGAILTFGEGSHAIVAQSIGGGGGIGGNANSIALSLGLPCTGTTATCEAADKRTKHNINLSVAVGGDGAMGADAGTVYVTNRGAIQTTGQAAHGILAQAIGGGGGIGGNGSTGLSDLFEDPVPLGADNLLMPFDKAGSRSQSVGVGGTGGTAGNGGLARVTNSAGILTLGDWSQAIFVQSIGGGGGIGGAGQDSGIVGIGGRGAGGGNGAEVAVIATAGSRLETRGSWANGILAQSIGGGGGAGGGGSGNVSIGRTGGGAGNGGTVNLNNAGSILTRGSYSAGILAQSVGGGGGMGGAGGELNVLEPANQSIAIGADSGSSGNGAGVVVVNTGAIATQGTGSFGIAVQSIGGGGGLSAFEVPAQAVSETSAEEAGFAGTLDTYLDRPLVSIGGKGASGGNGGVARVTHNGTIATEGLGAHGILAQSVGGGGGAGSGTGLVDLGSRGGTGGNGGTVEVTLARGRIATTGIGAVGILAQSLGGGGGSGTTDLRGWESFGYDPGRVSIRLGGSAGARGSAGAVTVTLGAGSALPGGPTSGARIDTSGLGAFGILAQSLGGGGGFSGGSASTSDVGLGADGGRGHARRVVVGLTSDQVRIIARGAESAGIVAQSISGGGGASAGTAGSTRLGGEGWIGNGASDVSGVDLTLAGVVASSGADSPAVLGQAILGGGGIAGTAERGLALGGSAVGEASITGVSAMNSGLVQAEGARSPALLLQGITGGGGYATGTPASGTVQLGGESEIVAAILPGSGVSANNAGTIVALGQFGTALAAQSVGGGGGFVGSIGGAARLGGASSEGGYAVAVVSPGTLQASGPGGAAAILQSVGGGGGLVASAGGAVSLGASAGAPQGGSVAVSDLGTVIGGGLRTIGVVAQSIGGGGGTVLQAGGGASLGGGSAGSGGAVALSGPAADVLTPGAALLAQSVGGGGGAVVMAAGAVTLGGSAGGAGGSVGLALGGTIETTSNLAPAVIAQSIGGGGGVVLGGATTAALGGTGGGGGSMVDLTNMAGIATAGRGSIGLVAQSIGGGGGLVAGASGALGVAATGSGDGGSVAVTNSGAIGTRGAAAHGILAQSVGGGGGAFLGPMAAGQAATLSGGTGNGGPVTVTNSGAVAVSGSGAHGIVAQSAGGGGVFAGTGTALPGAANTGLSGHGGGAGFGGDVLVINSASVSATGARGVGIWAESSSLTGAGAVGLQLDPGSAVIGGAGGTGVHMLGGALTLTNDGEIGGVDGVAGRAILARGSSASITNRGTITGSIDAGTGAITFTNEAGAMLNAGARIGLAGGTLTNAGGVAPGGRGAIGTTELTGNFRQGATGTAYFDVEGQAASIRADRLNVSGTARLAGTVAAELLPGSVLPPGTHSATIIRAAGGVTLDSAPALTATPTLNTSWALSYPNANDVNLSVTLTTTAPSARMSANQRSVATALNNAAASNPTGFSSYSTSVYGATNATSYSTSMSSLGGDGGTASMLAAQGASHQFMMGITARLDLLQRSGDAGMAAPASFAPFAFGSAFGDEGATLSGEALLGMNSVADVMPSTTRFWAMPLGYGGRLDAGAALGTSAESRVGGFMMGFDHQVAPNLLVGAVGGYSNGSYDAGQLIARGQLEGGHMGGYAMWRSGPLYMSGALAYARHEAKQSRIIGLEDQAEYARGNTGMHNASANLEFGARFNLGGFALSPFAGVGLNAWRQDGGTEASTAADGSGGVLGLTQQARSDYSMPISLGMRWDTTFAGPLGLAMTPYVRAAWVHETRNSLTSTASFALAADQSFNLVTPRTARDRLSMNLGMQMAPHERLGFGFGIIGDVGDGVQSIGGFGRMVVRW